jgi:DNA-binding MarR family transcriptional regulator
MEKLLIEFINTLDLSLKKLQQAVGGETGMSTLTIHQLQYIDAIYELSEPTITEIADRLHITKASVTPGVNKLIHKGYVIKTQSSEDRRVFHVSLTDAGEKLVRAKYQALEEYGEFIRAALSEDEARQFAQTLQKLVKLFAQASE